uniref:Uncharacterized protein n=1 Tax=Oryza meridionalis TaxID=40149 RepID=A0A0E0CG49_9ORYZ
MNWPGEPNRKLRGEVEVVKKYIVNNFNLPSHLSSVELYEVLGILNWRRACHRKLNSLSIDDGILRCGLHFAARAAGGSGPFLLG